MKFCSSNYQKPEILNQLDEIRYYAGSFTQALKMAEDHPEKNIILEVERISSLKNYNITYNDIIKMIKEIPNFYVDFYRLDDLREVAIALNKTGKYMYHFPVTTYGMIQILRFYNVSYITLGDYFSFNLKYVRSQLGDIKTRMNPVLGASALMDDLPGTHINSPWILPQHIHLYEPYIDVLDLTDKSATREATIVDIYLNQKEYKLPLSLLVNNCTTELTGTQIDEALVQSRMFCYQQCLINQNACQKCHKQEILIKKLAAIHNNAPNQ